MRKVVSCFMILFLILTVTNTYAASYSFDYTVGEQAYELSIDKLGSYEFYLPFDSKCMEIKYNCSEDGSIATVVNENTFFSVATSENTSLMVAFTEVIRKGDCDFKLECSGEIAVDKVIFHKVEEPTSYSGPENLVADQRNVIEFTEYEDAIRTAIIINKNYPVIKVYGANRYVNYDDVKETPYFENGVTYLPIHTFARAFGYYYEQDDGYFLLRTDNIEFVFKSGKLYKQINQDKYTEITNNILQKNSNVYIPVEYYAQAVGKTVLTKDDYIIADQRDLAKKIMSDEIFDQVCAEFESFMSTETENVYYVSQTNYADDDNPGTAEEPFATLAKACAVADAGDRVIIGTGVYREILKPMNNGTVDNPIIFEAAEGAQVTISALEEIGAPDFLQNGLYVYNMDWDLGEGRNQVFYKNDALAEARHPNSNTSRRYFPDQLELSSLWPTQGNIQVNIDGVADTATSTTDLQQPDDYWKDATLVSLHARGYGMATAKIISSENGKLYLGDRSTRLWQTSAGSDSEDYIDFAYITNTINAVDVANEWYWGDGKLYVYPPENVNRDDFHLEAKKRQITVDLTDKEYIQLIGINTVGGGMILNNSEMCVINGGTHKYISHFTYTDDTETGFIDTRDSIGDVYDDDAAPYRGEVGFYIDGRNNAVLNTRIEYSASGALCLDGAYNYIENNFISECGYMGGGTNGIYLFSSPNENITIVKGGHCLYNNTIDKTGRASLNLSSWTYPLDQENGLVPWVACDIAYNDFLNSNINTRDNGAIYAHGSVLGDERRKLQFHHNIIENSWVSDGYGAGIYWDNYSQMAECYDNIVLSASSKIGTDSYLHIASPSSFPQAFGYVNQWNNVDAGYVMFGKAGLSLNDYPFNKWFATGYNNEGAINNNIETIIKNTMLSSSDAEISSENVTVDINGAVYLNKESEWICFKDVEFNADCQAIALLYFGDRYSKGDKILVEVGDYSVETTLENTASCKSNVNEKIIPLDNIYGTYDVYIKCIEYNSAGILGINLKNEDACVNSQYCLTVTDDNDKYYLSGNAEKHSAVIAAVTGYDDDKLYSIGVCDADEAGRFNVSLDKTEHNGAYQMKLFSWESLSNLKPLNPVLKLMYEENKYKNPFETIKFKDAERVNLISDGTAAYTYGKNDIIVFENVDFNDNVANSISINYGLDDSEIDKLTVKMYLDSIDNKPVLVFSPEGTGERFNRAGFEYAIDTQDAISGCRNVYFVIEGNSSLPMHLVNFRFEDINN